MIYGLTMKPRVKRLWVKNLRSDKFMQGRKFLKKKLSNNSHEYCCLGVLSEQQKVPSRDEFLGGCYIVFQYNGYCDTSLPSAIWFAKYFNFEPNTHYKTKLHATNRLLDNLAAKNDGTINKRPWSFEQIANWIEKNL